MSCALATSKIDLQNSFFFFECHYELMSVYFFNLFIFYKFIFIYLFLAALGLRCCAWAFSSCGERGLLFIAVRGLLSAVGSLVVEHGLSCCGAQALGAWASVVVAWGL